VFVGLLEVIVTGVVLCLGALAPGLIDVMLTDLGFLRRGMWGGIWFGLGPG